MAIMMHCPHCRAVAIARSSNVLTSTSRDLFYQCSNVACGHTFRAVLEVNCTISPSATPDPKVVIPMSKHIRRGLLGEQLQRMPTADYEPDLTGQIVDLFDATPEARPG